MPCLRPPVLVEADIARIAELRGALLAMDHPAGDEPRAAEHRGSILDLALRERMRIALEDTGRSSMSTWLHINLDAEPGCFTDQKARRADRALPK